MTLTAIRPPPTLSRNRYADLIWGGYARISRDPDDKHEGVDRQAEDIVDAILGLDAISPELGDETRMMVENDTGAFKKRRVSITDQYGETFDVWRVMRPKWARALRDLRAGRIQALMVYDLDRLARDPRDLEDAIEIVEHHGAVIKSASASEIDLMTESGRMTARIMVTMANKASADAARRGRRKHLAQARSGEVNRGGRPFGWQKDKIKIKPSEARLLRKAAADIIDGAGLRTIVREWNEAGVKTSRGNEWDHRALRQLLKGPRLAGWRVYQGEIAVDAAGQPVRGIWKPILDQETFDRLQLGLGRRAGAPGGRRGARKYLLSGVARCGVCGGRMYATPTPTGHAYSCHKGGTGLAGSHVTSITGVMTDNAVTALIAEALREQRLDAPEPPSFSGSDRLAEIPALISELMAAFNSKALSGTIVFPQVKALEEEKATLANERQRFIARTSGPDVTQISAEEFEQMDDVDEQRAVIERMMEAVVIAPAKARGARWSDDRLDPVWRS